MRRAKTIYLFVVMVIIVPVTVFGITVWYENHVQRLPVLGAENHRVGNFAFTDQTGSHFDISNWNGKIVVADYFFTSCPSVCPKVAYQLKRIQALADGNIIINSFTVDPERDTVGKLKIYAEKMGIANKWHLLTGDKISLYRFARKELMLVATDGDGGPADFIHSENMVLIDPDKRIRGYYKGTDAAAVDQLMIDIKKLKTEFKL